jgi:hypothetical protein
MKFNDISGEWLMKAAPRRMRHATAGVQRKKAGEVFSAGR